MDYSSSRYQVSLGKVVSRGTYGIGQFSSLVGEGYRAPA
jgi:hypothetical protein